MAPLSPRISSRSIWVAGCPCAAKLANTVTPAPFGLKLDHRAVFADELLARARELRSRHAQRPEQHPQRIEVMDQDFRDQHAPFPAHEGLPLQRRDKVRPVPAARPMSAA